MKKEMIVVLALLLSFSFVNGHHPDEEGNFEAEGRDAFSQMPNFALKMNYLSHNYVMPNFNLITILVILIGLGISFFKFNKIKKKKKKEYGFFIYLWASLVIFLVLLYGVSYYYESGAEEGIVICDDNGECEIAMHIHAEVDAEVCGEKIMFGLEKGDLSKSHTHKERNLIHWHDVEKVDKNKEIINKEELTLRSFFEQMEIKFSKECLDDKCNGDLCNGKEGKVKMFVNGKENFEFDDYVWKDGDKIEIKFE